MGRSRKKPLPDHNSPEAPGSGASGAFHCFVFAAGRRKKARCGAFHTPPCRTSVLSSQMSDPDLQNEQEKKNT